MKQTTALRKLISRGSYIVVPGAYDVLSSKILEAAGFDALYLTGYGASASLLGAPDVGLLSMTEMLNHAFRMTNCISIPLICDIDNGYGNALNVIRAVRSFEKAGVAAIQLEDQVLPKRCGHMNGKQVIPCKEMVNKIKAAVDTRIDQDLVIIARTDARAVYGLENALERAQAYVDAGADVIFVEAPHSKEEMIIIRDRIKVPLLANMIEEGKTPLLSAEELSEIGYEIVIYPLSTLYTSSFAIKKLAAYLKEQNTTKGFDNILTFSEFNNIVDLEKYYYFERHYGFTE